MIKARFLELVDKFNEKYHHKFDYKEFETRLVAMDDKKGFMFFVDEDDNEEDTYISVSFCYDLNPNAVKNLMLKMLIFMNDQQIIFSFADEFYISEDSSLVFGDNAKNAWYDSLKSDYACDFKHERDLDEMLSTMDECEFVHC